MMGRFQPFHLGHLDLVKQILSQCDQVIIAITSSQFNYISKDPFTAGERIDMIHNSIQDDPEIDSSRCIITTLENQFNVATWVSYLEASLPKFDRVYTGNDYVAMLLAKSGYDVISPKFSLNREQYRATNIRDLIIKGKNWQELLPKAVTIIIKEIDGERRLETISKSDTKPTEY
jgi:nicotinamide-nucleotide adenylyltransferase